MQRGNGMTTKDMVKLAVFEGKQICKIIHNEVVTNCHGLTMYEDTNV